MSEYKEIADRLEYELKFPANKETIVELCTMLVRNENRVINEEARYQSEFIVSRQDLAQRYDYSMENAKEYNTESIKQSVGIYINHEAYDLKDGSKMIVSKLAILKK